MRSVVEEVRAEAESAWPDVDWRGAALEHGAFHDVLLTPTVVARISRSRFAADALEARASLLTRLSGHRLGIDIPEVRGELVRWASTRAGILLSLLPGRSGPIGEEPPPSAFAQVLDVVHNIDCSVINGEVIRSWCGGERFLQIVADKICPHLPAEARSAATRVVAELLEAERGAPTCFVHGDLTPFNIRWNGERPTGLLDWDCAAMGDPAIDLAGILTTVGASTALAIAEPESVERATLHRATFPLQIACAGLLHDDARLRTTGMKNFQDRLTAGTLHWPQG